LAGKKEREIEREKRGVVRREREKERERESESRKRGEEEWLRGCLVLEPFSVV